MKNRKLVYIAHPYRAKNKQKVVGNFKKAMKYGRKAWRDGLIPIIPHFNSAAIFGFMGGKDNDVTEYDLHLLQKCDLMWVCGNKISTGMQIEINFCKDKKIKISHIINF